MPSQRRPWYVLLAGNLGLATAYFAAGRLGLKLAFVHVSATAVWPPTGICLAALLLWGRWLWPGVLLGALATNLVTAGGLATGLGIAAGNTLEAVLGAWLVDRYAGGAAVFERSQDSARFSVFVLLASSVAATLGVASLCLTGYAVWSNFGPIWQVWWLGDVCGALLVTPVAVQWVRRPRISLNPSKVAEGLVILALLLAYCLWLFTPGPFQFPLQSGHYPARLLSVPLLLWLALRFDSREVSGALLVLSGLLLAGTLKGVGPFVLPDEGQSVFLVQVYMGVVAVTLLCLSAAIAQRRLAEETLRRSNQELDQRVAERSAEVEEAMAELKRSHDYFNAIMSQSEETVSLLDREGNIRFISPSVRKVMGFSQEEVLGKSGFAFVYPAYADEVRGSFLKMVREGLPQLDLEIDAPDKAGNSHHLQIHLRNLLEAPEARGILVTTRDVTSQRRAEQERALLAESLKLTEGFFQAVTENSHELITLLDRDGKITYVSPSIHRLLGYTQEERMGADAFDLVHPEDMPRVAAVFQQAVTTPGFSARVDFRYKAKDGSWRVLEAQGQNLLGNPAVSGLLVSSRDITERKQAEKDRESSESKFHELADATSEGILITERGLIQEVNDRICLLLGFRREELLGRHVADLAAPEYQELVRRNNLLDRTETYEAEALRKDGSRVLLEITGRPIEFGGKPAHVKVVRDLTERRQAQQQRQRAESLQKFAEGLASSNRELMDFTSVVSHDLREPLRKVQTFGNLLATRAAPDLKPDAKDYLARMRQAAERMEALLEDLLKYSRVETRSASFAPTDLAAVAREAVADLEGLVRKTGGQVRFSDGLPRVEADATQMRQLLQNLLGNALKYHKDGVAPQVEIRGTVEAQPDFPEGRACVLEVRDNGIGFEEQYLDRIFKAFERLHTRDEYEGTGMGLAICKRIVERHHGRITANSRPGEGSVFRVLLPLKQPPAMPQ
jgi:PAS domain S-box-containing protein